MAETDHLGVHLEHINKLETGLVQQNSVVRDCPSLVGGRPAKSVVERPRGFKSHIPRHFELWHSVSQFVLHICCEESVYCGFLKKEKMGIFRQQRVLSRSHWRDFGQADIRME